MRVSFDEETDSARIYLSDERQSHERGCTYAVLVQDEENPAKEAILVQLGFEGYDRLLWIEIAHASRALPQDLLAQAERDMD